MTMQTLMKLIVSHKSSYKMYEGLILESVIYSNRPFYSNRPSLCTCFCNGLRQKFATVYPVICCLKWFDFINYVTFHWMTCSLMWLEMLLFDTQLQNCIGMGITICKIFILGGISSDICSPLARHRKTKFQTAYPTIYLPK